MTQIKKAVITAAGPRQRALALQSLVDRDGETKSAVRVLVEEALGAGVEEVGLVICPGDEGVYRAAAGPVAGHVRFLEQTEPRGYGHALLMSKDWIGDAPFLHMVGDHLYVSRDATPCARQLVTVAMAQECAVSAVQPTRERSLPQFGAIGGRRVSGQEGLYQVDEVLEKPTPTEAEQRLVISGLRTGHYLCFFGMHVLTPTIFDLISSHGQGASAKGSGSGMLALSPALAALARRERYLAVELKGVRYDIGDRYGLWIAQLGLGLAGRDREELLARIVEMVASRG